ncbi:HD domain-containing phosphohydrolase [Phytoactinopolyspora halotolerans]|uniref:HD domain-containing protein n=1 Tax=Phytoactinopolyspora halotolerans TaxID=1981512 RepID=A0A6L9SJA3_9ACTN|nr:HD domain-containing phosphohydrolase [Phytoactinopolyspora halotolerans]NEE04150.1 HD domain-containing protein [Phytoactinopolyspora halotolerans]
MFRLLGLLGGLAAVTDLGTGAAPDESLRRCVLASRLAREAGCDAECIREVVYVSLLQHLGCTAYAHELAQVWGDDVATNRHAFLMGSNGPREMLRVWIPGMAEATGRSRMHVFTATVRGVRKVDANAPAATCDVAREAARRLGLPEAVQHSLGHTVSMWNGKGYPKVAGVDIPLSTRLMHIASVAVLFLLHAGVDAAVAEVRRRSGSSLDPELVGVFLSNGRELLAGIETIDAHQAALDNEPDPVFMVDEADVETVARTFGDLADLKSPWLHGHSSAVATLAADATAILGLSDDVRDVRIAGYLHDVGRVAISSRIWDKTEPLSPTERDQARLHPYHSERVLARVPMFAAVADLAGQHHERCDGSGYHRGLTGERMTMPARVLGAADAYRTLIESRSDAEPMPSSAAAQRLRDEARAGCLDGDAVQAVLEAAGHQHRGRRVRTAGLTERQIEVLRLVARGLSNAEIADQLVISRRTAENHVQDVYTKIGVSTRAAAAMFAMEHGLAGGRS